jgi:hypothetical protein
MRFLGYSVLLLLFLAGSVMAGEEAPIVDCGGLSPATSAGERALCRRLAQMMSVLDQKLDLVRAVLSAGSNFTLPRISSGTVSIPTTIAAPLVILMIAFLPM